VRGDLEPAFSSARANCVDCVALKIEAGPLTGWLT
jgi:hypothetical protein